MTATAHLATHAPEHGHHRDHRHPLRTAIANPWLRGGAAAVTFLFVGLAASDDDGPILCPFRRCTGGYCPGCGMTRSAGQLLRGDLAGSWRYHPFLVLAFAQLALFGGAWTVASDRLRTRLRTVAGSVALANAGVLFAIWFLRLWSGSIPTPFGL